MLLCGFSYVERLEFFRDVGWFVLFMILVGWVGFRFVIFGRDLC